jgi:transcriptional regulator GlxA family with amidase domain
MRRIAIVIFEDFSLAEVNAIAEMFQMANNILPPVPVGAQAYRVSVLSTRESVISSGGSLRLWAEAVDAYNPRLFEAIFVSGGRGAQAASHDAHLLSWLRQLTPEARVTGVASGSEAILTRTGHAVSPWTWGGGAAAAEDSGAWQATAVKLAEPVASQYERAVDAVLEMVRSDLGVRAMLEVEKSVRRRPRMHLVEASAPRDGARGLSDRVAWSVGWMHENCSRSMSIVEMARQVSMSERNFLRRFKQETGHTPGDYMTKIRLDLAQRLLAESDLPAEKIARRCGFVNGDHLRKLFLRHLSVSPADYRQAARSGRAAGADDAGETASRDDGAERSGLPLVQSW